MVPSTGFEPVIFAVRGRRPKPLDQLGKKMAAEEGFEPSRTDPESAVLPLDDSVTLHSQGQALKNAEIIQEH